MPNTVPLRYIPKQLTRKDKDKQRKELAKSQKLYKKNKYYTRKKMKSFVGKPSKHVVKAQKLYGIDNLRVNRTLSRKTKCSLAALKKIFRKGQGAYFSSGSRPNQTPHSWAYARLASAITGGKSSAVDWNILSEFCSKNSPALKLANKSRKKYKYGRRKVVQTPLKTNRGGSRRKWSQKYKDSIDCERPSGFSQKQYCKYGRK